MSFNTDFLFIEINRLIKVVGATTDEVRETLGLVSANLPEDVVDNLRELALSGSTHEEIAEHLKSFDRPRLEKVFLEAFPGGKPSMLPDQDLRAYVLSATMAYKSREGL